MYMDPSGAGSETSPIGSGGNTPDLRPELCFHHLRSGVNIISCQPGGPIPESNRVEAIRCLGNCTEPGECEVVTGSPAHSGHCGPGQGSRQAEGPRLTGERRHRCGLAIAGPQDGRDDIVDKALGDAHLEQGLGHGALGHVDEGRLPQ